MLNSRILVFAGALLLPGFGLALILAVAACTGSPKPLYDELAATGHEQRKQAICDAYRLHNGISKAARGEVRFRYRGEWIKCHW